MTLTKLILFTLFFAIPIGCFPQRVTKNFSFIKFNSLDGLPQQTVMSIFQDAKGFLWLATRSGLSRFDGKQFVNFYTTNGLGDDFICDVSERNNKLIVLSRQSLNFQVNENYEFSHSLLPKDIHADYFSSVLAGRNGFFIFNVIPFDLAVDVGFRHYYFDAEHRKYNRIKELDGSDIVTSAYGLANEMIVFTRKGELFVKKDNQQSFTRLAKISGTLLAVCKINDSTFAGYDPEKKEIRRIMITPSAALTSKICSFSEEFISMKHNLVSNSKGDIYIHCNVDRIYQLTDSIFHPVVNTRADFYDIYIDRQKNLWAGTVQGLFNFFQLGFEEITFGKPFNDAVMGIVEDKDKNLWFSGHGNGIWKYQDSVYKDLPLAQIKGRTKNLVLDYYSQQPGSVNLYDSLLMFPSDLGLVIHEKRTWRLAKYDMAIGSIVQESHSGKILCTTNFGLKELLRNGKVSDVNTSNLPRSEYPLFLYKDHLSQIWALTPKETGIIHSDTLTADTSLENIRVVNMVDDASGNYWFGSMNGLFVKNTRSLKRLGENLILGRIYGLLVYKDQFLLVLTQGSLFMLDLEQYKNGSQKWYIYNRYCGFTANDIVYNGIFKDSKDYIWILALDKVIRFKPDTLISKHYTPKIFFNAINASSDNLNWQNYLNISNKPLPPDQRNVSIEYMSISLDNPEGILYQYRLGGLDNNWSKPTFDRHILFRNLSKGSYQFQVRTSFDGVNWNADTATIDFYIAPFWYQTGWFYAGMMIVCGLSLAGVLRFYAHIKMKEQKRQLEQLLAVQLERQRISMEMHDEIGAGLSGVRLQTELIGKKAAVELRGDIKRIHTSISELSDKMREVIWSLSAEFDTLHNLISYLRQQAFKKTEFYEGELIFNLPDEIPPIKINGEKRRAIYMAMNEALNNAMKHSSSSRIVIETVCTSQQLMLTVADNGKGFETTSPGRPDSNGLKNMQRNIEKAGGDMHIFSNGGTKVKFSVSLKNLEI